MRLGAIPRIARYGGMVSGISWGEADTATIE